MTNILKDLIIVLMNVILLSVSMVGTAQIIARILHFMLKIIRSSVLRDLHVYYVMKE